MDEKDKKEESKNTEVDTSVDVANGHAMDHVVIKISDGKTTKEIINQRG